MNISSGDAPLPTLANDAVNHGMDEVDFRIVALLRRDGRMPFKTIAAELGLTEATVRSRVRRMEESDSLRVVAVTDYEAVGFSLMLAVGIQVEGRPADAVAEDLAAFSQVFSVCQVVGTLDIEALAVARDQDDLNALLVKLAAVPGVRKLEPSVALDVLKNQSNWVPFGHGV